MSEKQPTTNYDLRAIANEIAVEAEGQTADVHPFLSISGPESIDIIIKSPDSLTKQRYLLARELPSSQNAYRLLKKHGVRQLHRIVPSEGIAIYNLPDDIKRLSHQQFSGDTTSSDTHISDTELFQKLGAIWGSVYRISKTVPSDALSGTAIQHFGNFDSMLLPIPPYNDWRDCGSSTEASDAVLNSLVEGLRFINPALHTENLALNFVEGWKGGR